MRFWIGHYRDNAASARGMAKAGFREVGTAHRRADGQLLFVPSAPAERAAAAKTTRIWATTGKRSTALPQPPR